MVEFFVPDEIVTEKLQKFLKTKINQMNFHDFYCAIKPLGKGSFASVYLVKQRQTGELFAVKAFSKAKAFAKNKGREGIINEINIMRDLDHPTILKMYEIHETPRSIYMILELMNGGRLLDLVEKCRKGSLKITDKDISKIMKKLLQSLEYIHKLKIMHRDIKLENIIFRKKEDIIDICLVDFGLATFIEAKEYLYYKCGTPGYVGPELLNISENSHEKYGEKCDIFSLGVVLFIMYMHYPPFYDKNQKNIILNNKNCQINWQNAKEKINPEAYSLICAMLEKSPEKRISASNALNHSFIKYYSEEEDMLIMSHKSDSNDPTLNDFYGIPISITIPKFNREHSINFHEKNCLSNKTKLVITTTTIQTRLKDEKETETAKRKRRKSLHEVNILNAEGQGLHDGASFPNSIVIRTAIFTGSMESIKNCKSLLDKSIFNFETAKSDVSVKDSPNKTISNRPSSKLKK